jgi:fatty-acyl-CoA synthase
LLEGLMQHDHPLTIAGIVERMRTINASSTVTTVADDGQGLQRSTFAEIGDRVDRLCRGLRRLGVGEGERVGTFCWNRQEHLEAYLAVPSMGAVLHTANIRLFPDQLTYVVNHAEDRVMLVDGSLVPLLEPVAPRFETVTHYVLVGEGDPGTLARHGEIVRYDELIAGPPGYDYPSLDDRAAAALCYTTGTTGHPKGVLYSHRSNVLHSLAICLPDALGVSSDDVVLPVVPMFHANGWGMPYACGLVGADLVLINRFLQPAVIARLIEEQRATLALAVPTIWMDLLRYADEHRPDLSSLRMVPSGGAATPRSLIEAFEDRHGVPIVPVWGMTETSPLGAVTHVQPGVSGEARWDYKLRAGRIAPGVEARLVDEAGQLVPWDGQSTGELEVRGPWVASGYFKDPSPERFDDGWLRTGDVAAISPDGHIRITDRAKDVIKSGGEWISSVDVENQLMAHPAVHEAAVIAKPDDRWTERPLACVVLREGSRAEPGDLAAFLRERVAAWWVPDEFAFLDEVPKTSVGKFDKKLLRQRLAEDRLAGRRPVEKGATGPVFAPSDSGYDNGTPRGRDGRHDYGDERWLTRRRSE